MSFRSLSAIVIPALLIPAGTSMAQTTTDPPAGSPAGTVYELPVDKGRSDGAPSGSRGAGSGDGAEGPLGEGSFYRSENNFGASSIVPGTSAAKSQDSAAAADTETASGSPPSGSLDVGSPSEGGALALLALLAAGGVGIGFVSRRSWT